MPSTFLAVWVLLLGAVPVLACSVPLCLGHGVEFDRDSTIRVRYEGQALAGVEVRVTRYGDSGGVTTYLTDARGTVSLRNLPPGDYGLDAVFLGISAASHCFHVAAQPSWRAKRRQTYKWGDWARQVRRVAGRLTDSQFEATVPYAGAELSLESPRTRDRFRAVSDEKGGFAMDEVPEGTYVLRISGGRNGREYDPTVLLVRIGQGSGSSELTLQRVESGCGTFLSVQ